MAQNALGKRILTSHKIRGLVEQAAGLEAEPSDVPSVLTFWALNRVINDHLGALSLYERQLINSAAGCLRTLVDDLALSMYCLHCSSTSTAERLKSEDLQFSRSPLREDPFAVVAAIKAVPRIGHHLAYIHQQIDRAMHRFVRSDLVQLGRSIQGDPTHMTEEMLAQIALADVILVNSGVIAAQAIGNQAVKQRMHDIRQMVFSAAKKDTSVQLTWPEGILDETLPEPHPQSLN